MRIAAETQTASGMSPYYSHVLAFQSPSPYAGVDATPMADFGRKGKHFV